LILQANFQNMVIAAKKLHVLGAAETHFAPLPRISEGRPQSRRQGATFATNRAVTD
jgi:hypothetical protein